MFVLPSQHENFGIAVLEALAFGLPVVLTKEVQLSGFVAEHSLGVIAGEPAEALASAIAEALADDVLTARCREHGPSLVGRYFSLVTVGQQLLDMYRFSLDHPSGAEHLQHHVRSRYQRVSRRRLGGAPARWPARHRARRGTLRRIKHWAGFPTLSIQRCLEVAGITGDQVSHVAISRDPRANILQKAKFALTKRPNLSIVRDRLQNARKLRDVPSPLAACARSSAREAADAALRGASSRAPRERLLRLAVRRRGDLRDRRLRRLREHIDGCGQRKSLRRSREGVLPALTWDALHRRHAVSRLHGIR